MIADYGHGDLAFAEVRQRLALFVPEAEVFLTPVPASTPSAPGSGLSSSGAGLNANDSSLR